MIAPAVAFFMAVSLFLLSVVLMLGLVFTGRSHSPWWDHAARGVLLSVALVVVSAFIAAVMWTLGF